jgi:hypothetical protein
MSRSNGGQMPAVFLEIQNKALTISGLSYAFSA